MTNIFIDTNVLVYFWEPNHPKQMAAQKILARAGVDFSGVITPFVLNEVHHILLKLNSWNHTFVRNSINANN